MSYRKLRGKIIEVFGEYGAFAEAMGFSRQTLSNKLSRNTDFSIKQITKACALLGIGRDEIPVYFFAEEVQFS